MMVSKLCSAIILAVALTTTGAIAAEPPEYCEEGFEEPGLEGLCVAAQHMPEEALVQALPGLLTAAQNIFQNGQKP